MKGDRIPITLTPEKDFPRRHVTGITSFWIFGVEVFTREGTNLISEGIGDLHVTELSTDGQVIHANFHPEDSEGYGTVINPFFRFTREGGLNHPRYWLTGPARRKL